MVVISKSYAAEVVIRGQKPLKIKEKIIIKVEEVSLDDLWFDSLALKQENQARSRLFCRPDRPKLYMDKVKKDVGGIIYYNYFQKAVKTFKFKSRKECMKVKKQMFSISEGVNDENPVIIHLNKKNSMVEKIILPYAPYIKDLS